MRHALLRGVVPCLLALMGSGCASSPLRTAIARGDVVAIDSALAAGANVDAPFMPSRTEPVVYACYSSQFEALKRLVDKGARISGRFLGDSPLTWCAARGRLDMVQYLLAKGAKITSRDIEAARLNGQEEIAVYLERARNDAAAPAAVAATTPAGLSKDELRQLMSEAVKAAAPAAPASPAPAAVIASDVDAPRYKLPERADDYAVVVGVEKYAGLPDATYAERDAKAVYEHLVALGYPARNIALLTGAQATKTGLIKNLEAWLPQNVSEKSSVFFYYSGHGAPDPTAGAAYLVPADGDPQYLDETSYPVKRLYEKLQALKAKRVLVAMDSCFSGSGGRSVLAKGTRPLVGKIELGAVTGKVASLTASASNQISGVIEAQGHGAFTYYLLRGLNGEAKDGAGSVTLKSLHGYLTPRVQDAAKRANRDQTPQLIIGDAAGDGVLR